MVSKLSLRHENKRSLDMQPLRVLIQDQTSTQTSCNYWRQLFSVCCTQFCHLYAFKERISYLVFYLKRNPSKVNRFFGAKKLRLLITWFLRGFEAYSNNFDDKKNKFIEGEKLTGLRINIWLKNTSFRVYSNWFGLFRINDSLNSWNCFMIDILYTTSGNYQEIRRQERILMTHWLLQLLFWLNRKGFQP